jgi:ribosomal protein S18 acetylase RimI-like enzyme
MTVRRFEDGDLDAVFAIQRAAYEPLYNKYRDSETSPYTESKETLLAKYTREGSFGYVFVEEAEIIGAVRVALFPEDGSARISALAVHPDHQGRGVAQRALAAIEVIHADAQRWFLDTIAEEAAICHLYEKLGYVKTGKLEKINEKMTLVFYEKKR